MFTSSASQNNHTVSKDVPVMYDNPIEGSTEI